MNEEDVKYITKVFYGSIVAHRIILQYMIVGFAQRQDDPKAFIRDTIDKCIIGLGNFNIENDPYLADVLKSAADELELIQNNLEERFGK